MSKLSGWSMFWIALTAIAIIAAIGRVILIHQERGKKTEVKSFSEAELKSMYDVYVYANTHGIIAPMTPVLSYDEWKSTRYN